MRRPSMLLAVLALGCGNGSPLFMEVSSDLVAGAEVSRFEVELYTDRPTASATPFSRVFAEVELGDSLRESTRVASFDAVEDGLRWAEVVAYDTDGRVLVRQPAQVEVAGRTTHSVRVDRDCVGVECPGAGGAPSDLACLGGRCVDPRCSPATPDFCPDWATCQRDSDCEAPDAPCARGACADGFCFAEVRGNACPEGQWCNPENGCEDLPGLEVDAGAAETDAGCVPTGCDGGTECVLHLLSCSSGMCEASGNAISGTPCSGGTCDGTGACAP